MHTAMPSTQGRRVVRTNVGLVMSEYVRLHVCVNVTDLAVA